MSEISRKSSNLIISNTDPAAFSNDVFPLRMSVCQRNLGSYPRSSGIQSPLKEMHLPKTCVSFGEECTSRVSQIVQSFCPQSPFFCYGLRRSNGLAVRVLTSRHTHTHTHTQKHGKTAPILYPRRLTREVTTEVS